MLEPKFHLSNSKNKDLLYNCILDKPIHSIDPWTTCSWVRSKRVKTSFYWFAQFLIDYFFITAEKSNDKAVNQNLCKTIKTLFLKWILFTHLSVSEGRVLTASTASTALWQKQLISSKNYLACFTLPTFVVQLAGNSQLAIPGHNAFTQ